MSWLYLVVGFWSLLVAACGLVIANQGRCKRLADREFGDWPDQIAKSMTRQPDDPGIKGEGTP